MQRLLFNILDAKSLALGMTLILIGLVCFRIYERSYSSQAEVLFWDVGQGDSALLSMPHGKNYLIDAGGGFRRDKVGEVLFKELSRKAVLFLDGFILSHPDQDHGGGAFTLFRKLRFQKMFISKNLENFDPPLSLLTQLKADAKSRQIKVVSIEDTIELSKDPSYSLKLQAFNPPRKKNTNNLSLVALLEIYGCRFLFTGDLEKEAERELLKDLKSPIQVLKVAHHGSKTSSHKKFLERTKPRWSVVSVGKDNRYGHPREEVLRRIRSLQSKLLRTDFHGYVSFKVFPSGKMKCQSALGDCGAWDCKNSKL